MSLRLLENLHDNPGTEDVCRRAREDARIGSSRIDDDLWPVSGGSNRSKRWLDIDAHLYLAQSDSLLGALPSKVGGTPSSHTPLPVFDGSFFA